MPWAFYTCQGLGFFLPFYFLCFNLAFSCLCLVIVNFDFGVALLLSLNFACVVLVSLVLREVLLGLVFPLSQQIGRETSVQFHS